MTTSADPVIESLARNKDDILSITDKAKAIDRELRSLPWWRYDKSLFLSAERAHQLRLLSPLRRSSAAERPHPSLSRRR